VQLENHVDLNAPLRLPPFEPSQPVKVRKRASRRAVKGEVDVVEAEARAQRVATKLMDWYNGKVGPSLLDYARVGPGRRSHIVDTTHVEVPLETGTYECSGVVKNDAGSRSRGYTLATLRTLLDHAGLITQVGLCPMQVHDLPLCRLFFETAPVLRQGDLVLEDRGFVDGETITFLKQQRHVDVIVPLKSTMLSYQEAVQLAELPGVWQPHPSRDSQHIAFVKGVDHVWDGCNVALNACVIRYWNRKKKALDHIVLVTTDQGLKGPWIVRHYEERPEIEQDYQQMKSGGWQLKKLSATRYSEIAFYIATVVLSYSLYHLFANTRAGAKFADKTRQGLAFEQLRSRRTHIIAYAGGHFEIFETLSFVRFVLQLPDSVQDRLRYWLDEHLHTVQQRE
jgi:Transposase DDE domain